MPGVPMAPMPMRRAQEYPVPAFVFWIYMAFYLCAFFNLSGIYISAYKIESLPIQPVTFAIAFALIMPLVRKKPGHIYFTVAWLYCIIFTIGGFLGPDRLAGFSDKVLWQLIIKQWINVVGVPMLMLRAVNPEKVPMVVKATVIAAVIGALFAVVQVRMYSTFARIIAEAGRGSGFWINPNSCVQVLSFCLFFSLAVPFRSKSVNLVVRGIIVLGMLATLSRTGVLLMIVGFTVYGIAAKRVRVVLQVAVVLVVVMVAASVFVGYLSQGQQTAGTAKRLARFSGLLRGQVQSEGPDNDRSALWKYGWDACMREPFFGRGHRFMDAVVPIGTGIGPHNYFLFVWGNSGILALLAWLAFLFTLAHMCYKCTDPQLRPPLLAISAMMPVIAMVDHSFLNGQTFGPIFATMVAMAYYARPQRSAARVPANLPMRPLPPRRPGGPAPSVR